MKRLVSLLSFLMLFLIACAGATTWFWLQVWDRDTPTAFFAEVGMMASWSLALTTFVVGAVLLILARRRTR